MKDITMEIWNEATSLQQSLTEQQTQADRRL